MFTAFTGVCMGGECGYAVCTVSLLDSVHVLCVQVLSFNGFISLLVPRSSGLNDLIAATYGIKHLSCCSRSKKN